MMEYALLGYLCLLSSAQVHSTEEKSKSISHFFIAPDKSVDETFAVVLYEEMAHQIPRKLFVRLRVYDQRTDDFEQCSLTLTARWGAAKAGVSAVRRLTGDKIVFAWYDEMLEAVDRRTRIVAMSDNCRQIDPVLDNLPSVPIILPSVAHQFDVIVDDEVTCRAVGKRCRVTYNLGRGNAGRVWPLNVNLDWSTMQVTRLRAGDYLVRGYDGTTYTILRLSHLTGKNDTLIVQFEANPQPEFVSSELSMCGTVYPGFDNFAQCVQYSETNQVVFQKRVTFDAPVLLIDVRSLGEGRLFVVVGKARCSDEFDCWKLYGVHARHGGEAAHPKASFSHFHCTGDRKALRIFDVAPTADNRIAVRYACKNDDEFNYNVTYFNVDDDDDDDDDDDGDGF